MDDQPAIPPQEPPKGAFSRFLERAKLVSGVGLSEEAQIKNLTRRCETQRDELLQHSPSVVFMLKHLDLLGHTVTRENITCVPCGPIHKPNSTTPQVFNSNGGFMHAYGAILLCAGRFSDKNHMENTLVHELVHMYDHARFRVNWNDLRHLACSEIRASSLSGDCRFIREIRRANFRVSKQHQACVRRRAVLSVAASPNCPDVATAERAVNEVWGSCFADTRPFDEIY